METQSMIEKNARFTRKKVSFTTLGPFVRGRGAPSTILGGDFIVFVVDVHHPPPIVEYMVYVRPDTWLFHG